MKTTRYSIMKNFGIAIVLLLSFSTLQAQNAKQLLNEVSAKVKSYKNIKIDFKYSLQNTKENIKQDTRGDVTLQGNNYVLNMLGTTRIFDGNKIYTIVPEDEEVTVSTYHKENNKDITPSEMLTFYEKGYVAKMDIIQNIKGRKIQFVKLTPINSNAEIKNILLGVDTQTKHIYKLIQTDANGTKYTLTVNSFKTNLPLSKNLFQFSESKYQKDGYYINKLD